MESNPPPMDFGNRPTTPTSEPPTQPFGSAPMVSVTPSEMFQALLRARGHNERNERLIQDSQLPDSLSDLSTDILSAPGSPMEEAEQIEEDDGDVEGDPGHEEEQDEEDDEVLNEDPSLDPSSVGLKEISNLASFTVSSFKPGCGVKELLDNDFNQFWQ